MKKQQPIYKITEKIKHRGGFAAKPKNEQSKIKTCEKIGICKNVICDKYFCNFDSSNFYGGQTYD